MQHDDDTTIAGIFIRTRARHDTTVRIYYAQWAGVSGFLILTVLLGKASGGERGISQTSLWYKAMTRGILRTADQALGLSDV